MNRREFIKISSLLGVGSRGRLRCCWAAAARTRCPGQGKVSRTPTFCDMCFWKCAALRRNQENDQPWKITGNDQDLHSEGRLCTRGTGGLGSYEDRDRLKNRCCA